MRKDFTDIMLVVDRSGSMEAIRQDAMGGVNRFILDQAEKPGEAVLTLVQFDTEYEFVHRAKPIKGVPEYVLTPRGGTALLDAVGRAINETGERLAAMPEANRPGLVVFVVMTDGEENSSREFRKSQIKEKISHQQDKYGWQFVFLGANQDAFAEAGAMGMQAQAAANFTPGKVLHAMAAASASVGRMRAQSIASETIENAFTESERKSME
jgi:Mg-chelatase subunit ChlD